MLRQDLQNGYPVGADQHDADAPVPDPELSDAHPSLSAGANQRVGSLAYAGAETDPSAGVDDVVAEADRSHEVYQLSRNPHTYEVTVASDIRAEDYEHITRPEDWAYLMSQAEPLRGTTWAYINPTLQGGGVAMLRPPAVNLQQALDIDAHWDVMAGIKDKSRGDPFLFTKLMHNISQRMTDERITEEGKATHWHWADTENGSVLERQPHILGADFIVFDDPQSAPLIERFKRVNPGAKTIWRNHIDTHHDLMADPTTPQGEVARYILDECGVRGVDAVIAHPVEAFVHPGMEGKTYFAPATIDPFDNLNRHLEEHEVVQGVEFINAEIASKNAELAAAGRHEDIQPELSMDPNKKRLTLIARFDPSKGMDIAMEMGVQARRRLRAQGMPEEELPEVVIVGNGSKDDPDGPFMYEEMLKLRREAYPDEASGITVMRLRHNYDAMNALMWRSTVIMQTSYAEGLENRIGDAERHGRPVVISNRGGMKTQVVEGQSGIILDYDRDDYDVGRGAEFMARMLTDPAAYQRMKEGTSRVTEELISREFTTTANVTRLLRVANRLRRGLPADKLWKVADMAAADGYGRYGQEERLAA